tara:strand:+ start:719 stop:1462 length:744 start_codon:yes stop_codon:yes gene_type:complete
MEEEEKKKHIIELLKGSDFPIRLTHFPEKSSINLASGSQNATINAPNPSGKKDASVLLEKEINLNNKTKAYLAHELKEKGKEGSGIHITNPYFTAGGSTDYDKEEKGYISGRTTTPIGNIGGILNTDFTQDESGEIFWQSPDRRWNVSGYTDFDDLQKGRIGYNTDKLNLNYNTDFGENEYLEAEYRPLDYVTLGAETDFNKNRNLRAGINYPISDNLLVNALIERQQNPYYDDDENRLMFGMRGNF